MPLSWRERELRERGHVLIDRLVASGMDRARVYGVLRSWLTDKNNHHFAKTKGVREAAKMVRCLERITEMRKNGERIPTKYPYYRFK